MQSCRQTETLREQIVTQQDACVLVPAGVDRFHMSACLGTVEHIVMNERRGVHHFDHGTQHDMVRREAAASGTRQEQHRRSKSFTAELRAMSQQRCKRRVRSGQLITEPNLYPLERGKDRLVQPLECL